jgi:iron complex transport system substrate-binding protein
VDGGRRPGLAAVCVAAVCVATAPTAACSTPGPAPAAAPPASVDVSVPGHPGPTAYPLTIDNCGVRVTFTGPPRRVLILNGTSVAEAESFVALDLGERVVANAQSYGVSDVPGMVEDVAALPKGGLTQNRNFDVPAEQVLAAGADLVVSTWSGGFDADSGFATREQLAAAGANTLVNPVNCALGNPDATEAEKATLAAASPRSSLEFLVLLGQVFDVQDRAYAAAEALARRIETVGTAVAGEPVPKMLIAFPGMAMMNSNGLPAVLAGGIYDGVLAAAGGVNAFAGAGADFTRTINAEQLATADVDLLVLGAFTPEEKPAEDAQRLFDAVPDWTASKNKAYVSVSDGVYLGPANAWAIEKIAKAAHPGRL